MWLDEMSSWYIFIPKTPKFFFWRPWNEKKIVYFLKLSTFHGHLVYFTAIFGIFFSHFVLICCGHLIYIFCEHLVYFVVIWYILRAFGILCRHLVYFLWTFGIIYGHLVCFTDIWDIFPFWYSVRKSGDLF
jgi:hypothetical protein